MSTTRNGNHLLLVIAATVALIGAVLLLGEQQDNEPRIVEVTTRYTKIVAGQPVECLRREDRVAGTVTTAC